MPLYQGEAVAQAVRRHQLEASNRWPYRDLLAELHAWVDRFDADFDLGLPTPVIALSPLRVTTLATYRLGRSDIGARTTITFNERWLPRRAFTDTLVTLMHEYLHAWEEWHGGREVGGWYHTSAWRAKMAEVGIVADARGRTLRVAPRFLAYLHGYGVPTLGDLLPPSLLATSAGDAEGTSPPDGQPVSPAKRRQLPKWVCGCPGGRPARAVALRARCLDCGQEYRSAEGPDEAGDGAPCLFSVGSSNRHADEFVALLREHGITRLFDVRSKRGSRTPHFDEARFGNLSRLLGDAGIAYDAELHAALGGLQDGQMTIANFRRYTATPAFRAALDELKRRVAEHPGGAVILCCERDPKACHRKVIADVLAREGWRIVHLL